MSDTMCGITYITLSYYVNILTYTYNFNKYIYEKISLSLILSIICNTLCNFVQPLAYKRVYNDLLQPCFLTFRTYVGRVYRPHPWASRTLILLVTYNRGYFQTIRIYDFRILGIADTPHTPTTQYSSISIVFQLSFYLLLLLPPIPHYSIPTIIIISAPTHAHSHLISYILIYPSALYIPKSLCSYQSLVFHLSSLHRFLLINSHYI